MQIEYEATFTGIDKSALQEKLQQKGALLINPDFLQTRAVFRFPAGHEIADGWIRVRNEGDRITMSIKVVNGNRIEDQKEICLKVDDFDTACDFLKTLGCAQKSYQESRRELWLFNDCEIALDEWPFLEPFVEIEGKSEPAVQATAKQLDFNWSHAKFCSVDTLYHDKYGVLPEIINNKTPKITFDMKNPFTT